VRIGAGSWLHSAYAFLHSESRRTCALSVGRNTGIYRGSFFELGPQGEVRIGDYCTLVEVIIATNRLVVIGDCSFLAHEVVIADHFAATPWRADKEPAAPLSQGEPSVVLGDDVWIGAGRHAAEGRTDRRRRRRGRGRGRRLRGPCGSGGCRQSSPRDRLERRKRCRKLGFGADLRNEDHEEVRDHDGRGEEVKARDEPRSVATMPARNGPTAAPIACAPKRMPMLEPPRFFGVASSSQAWITGRMA
jgi:hypothetical protein